MKDKNIYLCGVGGQGIGLLADTLARACLAAGYKVKGCDTHGLAQRHGTVVSHLRIGDELFTPRISPGQADLIVGLERLETLRAVVTMLKKSCAVVYYDAVYQPIHVRMGEAKYPSPADIEAVVKERGGKLVRLFFDDLSDPRMQNVVLLGALASMSAIEGVDQAVVERALTETVPKKALEENLAVFERALAAETRS
jgi:indolepyruvate ferredoxin oxidoreductase beta subunit